jgi:hypothetical protein
MTNTPANKLNIYVANNQAVTKAGYNSIIDAYNRTNYYDHSKGGTQKGIKHGPQLPPNIQVKTTERVVGRSANSSEISIIDTNVNQSVTVINKKSRNPRKLRKQLQELVSTGQLTRSDMDSYLNTSTHSNELTMNDTKRRNNMSNSEKVAEDPRGGNNAKKKDTVYQEEKRKSDGKSIQAPSKEQNNANQKRKVSKTVNLSETPVLPRDKGTKGSKPVHKTSGSITSKLMSKKGLLGMGATVLATYMLSTLGSSHTGNVLRPRPSSQFFDRQSAYIPDSYKRGYNDIKELTTDFGSSVHLDKAVNKGIRKPRSTTRHNYTTSTNSIMNSNASLSLHKNAINHTRY